MNSNILFKMVEHNVKNLKCKATKPTLKEASVMPYIDYTTEMLGLVDVNIIEVKLSIQCMDIFIMKPRRKHRCPAYG
jgi:hypothetical protein